MNKIGNKVDVPFGKLLTRILEGIFFPWQFPEGEPLSLVSCSLGKAGFEGRTGRQNSSRAHRSSLRSKPGPGAPGGTVSGESHLGSCVLSCGLTERASPWHEGIPFCRFCVGSLRFSGGRMVFSTGNGETEM